MVKIVCVLLLFFSSLFSCQVPKTVIVIGGGIGGSVAALELSKQVDQVIILEKDKIMGRTSASNPGRNSHGFHYTDFSTCKEMLLGSLCFEDYFPDHRRNAQAGWYLVVQQSQVSPEEYLAVCDFIRDTYQETRGQFHTDFGDPKNFYRELKKSEYEKYVNSDQVVFGVQTNEYNIDVDLLPIALANHRQLPYKYRAVCDPDQDSF